MKHLTREDAVRIYRERFALHGNRDQALIESYQQTGHKVASIERYLRDKPEALEKSSNESTWQQDGNEATLHYTGRIHALDDLIRHCKIDLAEWRVDSFQVKNWEMGHAGTAAMEWQDGRAKGWTKRGEQAHVTPLFSISAKFTALKPKPIEWPFIAPVEIQATFPRPPHTTTGGIHTNITLPDIHFGFNRHFKTGALDPYHDRKCLDIYVQIIRAVKPKVIVLSGDLFDFPECSDKFLKRPEVYFTIQPALVEAHWWLSQIRMAAPDAEIEVLAGNHDYRLIKAIIANMVAAAGLRAVDDLDGFSQISIPKLLRMDKLGINFIEDYPNGEYWLNRTTRFSHGQVVKQGGGNTGLAVLRDAQNHEVYGHIHRCEVVAATKHAHGKQRTYYAMSFGTGARIDGIVPGFKARNDWQQGLGVIEYDEELISPVPVPIFGGKAIYKGQLYVGRDHKDRIAEETKWEALKL